MSTEPPSISAQRTRQRAVACGLLALALISELFAYWGLSTVAGRSAFDEMAGMIPLAAGAAGLLFGLGALIAWWRQRPRE